MSQPLYRGVIALLTCLILLLGVGLTTVGSQDKILVKGAANYTVSGKFGTTELLPTQPVSNGTIRSNRPSVVLWNSWVQDGKHTGTLVSPPFPAPAILGLFVSGWFDLVGNQVFIEQMDTGKRLNLSVEVLSERWKQMKWFLPMDWHGRLIRIVAVDRSQLPNGWLGISSPLQIGIFSFLKDSVSSIILLPAYLLYFIFFLLPGLLLASQIFRKTSLNSAFIVSLAVALNCLIGYLAFWTYFINFHLGIGFSIFIVLATMVYSGFLLKERKWMNLLGDVDVIMPTLMMVGVGLLYLSTLFALEAGYEPENLVQFRFFSFLLPPDTIFPHMFAERLYSGLDPRPLLGDWLSSDRPPLQTGVVLLQRPLSFLSGSNPGLQYQILGTIAQCSWIAATWTLCRVLQLSGQRIAVVMAFCIFSGFFFFNSVFLWPKLLAASLVVFSFALLIQPIYQARRPTTTETVLAAGSAALGILTHGGVVFTLPAIAIMMLRPRNFPGMRNTLVGLLVIGLFVAPWTAYQKFYEPPANRLVKWHLAGVATIDARPPLQTIVDSYRSLATPQIISNKWENTKLLFGGYFNILADASLNKITTLELLRINEFFHTFIAVGILNIGWLLLPLELIAQRSKETIEHGKRVKLILTIGIVSLGFWVLVMFGPPTTMTTIHTGSYATMILLFTGLGALISQRSRILCYGLLAFQIVTFFSLWIISATFSSSTRIMGSPNIFMIGLAIASLLGLIKLFKHLSHTPQRNITV